MENKTKTDWTISRENINPKTKQPYKRGRNWGIVVYPESLPKNWKEIISTEPVVCVNLFYAKFRNLTCSANLKLF